MYNMFVLKTVLELSYLRDTIKQPHMFICCIQHVRLKKWDGEWTPCRELEWRLTIPALSTVFREHPRADALPRHAQFV